MAYSVVAVFGGAGFLGRSIVSALARQGAHVRIACRRPDEAQRCKPMGDVGQVAPVAANIRDDASVAAVVDGADAVINLVGILYESGRQKFDAIHRDGAARIARASSSAGVAQLVHISAIGADPRAVSGYARSKGDGEQAVKAAFDNAVILRPCILFGPDDDFFNRFAAVARFSPALPLIGGGDARFQPAYVCDVAEAVVAALTNPDTAGRTYELGGPQIYSFRQLLELLLTVIGRKRLLVPVPFWAAMVKAFFLELLPVPPLTRDQVRLLCQDNVVTDGVAGFADLGISPIAPEVILPTYLSRFRRGGAKKGVAAETTSNF
ncbi:MAG: complex I NDUFA9 subunit family protein [Alphaproteobacteria bacterium]|nr:complex I NDUFA9 subunit family protein [Alphaproteobacteria bacterium]